MAITDGDAVTIEYVGRLDDGTVFDTSRRAVAEAEGLVDDQQGREYTPLTVDVGAGEVIDGLDAGLVGMEPGDEETITVPPADGYGEHTDERVVEYDRDHLDEMLEGAAVAEGMRLQTEQGLPGEVVDVGESAVLVDFNHELAGETLDFEVEVVAVD